eukprot:CAMPEP_0114635338 /NCGR_PEP_ID=MMETSP0168-20121206/16432_1 /TAXON_ID=95228 ORGANISM="Vannella sp., Strain DIVA3 517/6/12" /NCGR_SAMPLE_ID=MMETSP0168 /ASSEMBLY_ACC=CAM_ASM_000044 /LENGTH=87 /DNA_ID=CAMNT_0001847043 /DNA_START=41 /DNA_END=304 /DNA_ORIENTATION=+
MTCQATTFCKRGTASSSSSAAPQLKTTLRILAHLPSPRDGPRTASHRTEGAGRLCSAEALAAGDRPAEGAINAPHPLRGPSGASIGP